MGKRCPPRCWSTVRGYGLCEAHNSTVGGDRKLTVNDGLATARKQVYDLSLSPSPTFDDAGSLEIGELRELTEYLAHTCFPEIAVPQATADLVDVAAAALGFRSAGRSPAEAAARQDAFWEMHDALFADQGRLDGPHLWTRAEAHGSGRRALRGRQTLGRGA